MFPLADQLLVNDSVAKIAIPSIISTTIFQLKGRKRQPPKSGSQNARRALVETEFVVGNLISALPRLLGLAAAHAAVVEQHAEVQMVQEASQHVQEARQRRQDRHVTRLLQCA